MALMARHEPTPASHWSHVWQTPTGQPSWYEAHPTTSLRMVRRTGVPASGRVVDVGGGASTLVDHLLADGRRYVTVVDIAPESLRAARERLRERAPFVDWQQADVLSWRPTEPYDLWHDRALFHFLVDDADRARYRHTMAHALRPGGAAVIATFADDGPETCSGLPVARYDESGLTEAFEGLLEPVEFARQVHRTPSGVEQPFLYGSFRRAETIS